MQNTDITDDSKATDITDDSKAGDDSKATDITDDSKATDITDDSKATDITDDSKAGDDSKATDITDDSKDTTDMTDDSKATDITTDDSKETDSTDDSRDEMDMLDGEDQRTGVFDHRGEEQEEQIDERSTAITTTDSKGEENNIDSEREELSSSEVVEELTKEANIGIENGDMESLLQLSLESENGTMVESEKMGTNGNNDDEGEKDAEDDSDDEEEEISDSENDDEGRDKNGNKNELMIERICKEEVKTKVVCVDDLTKVDADDEVTEEEEGEEKKRDEEGTIKLVKDREEVEIEKAEEEPEGDLGKQVVPEGDQGEEIKPKGGQGEEIKPEGGQGEEIKPEGDQGEEIKPEGDQCEEIKPEGDQGEEIKPEGDQCEEIKPEGDQGEEIKHEGDQGEEIKPEGDQGEEIKPEGDQGEEIKPEGGQGEAIKLEGGQGEQIKPEGDQGEEIKPEGGQGEEIIPDEDMNEKVETDEDLNDSVKPVDTGKKDQEIKRSKKRDEEENVAIEGGTKEDGEQNIMEADKDDSKTKLIKDDDDEGTEEEEEGKEGDDVEEETVFNPLDEVKISGSAVKRESEGKGEEKYTSQVRSREGGEERSGGEDEGKEGQETVPPDTLHQTGKKEETEKLDTQNKQEKERDDTEHSKGEEKQETLDDKGKSVREKGSDDGGVRSTEKKDKTEAGEESPTAKEQASVPQFSDLAKQILKEVQDSRNRKNKCLRDLRSLKPRTRGFTYKKHKDRSIPMERERSYYSGRCETVEKRISRFEQSLPLNITQGSSHRSESLTLKSEKNTQLFTSQREREASAGSSVDLYRAHKTSGAVDTSQSGSKLPRRFLDGSDDTKKTKGEISEVLQVRMTPCKLLSAHTEAASTLQTAEGDANVNKTKESSFTKTKESSRKVGVIETNIDDPPDTPASPTVASPSPEEAAAGGSICPSMVVVAREAQKPDSGDPKRSVVEGGRPQQCTAETGRVKVLSGRAAVTASLTRDSKQTLDELQTTVDDKTSTVRNTTGGKDKNKDNEEVKSGVRLFSVKKSVTDKPLADIVKDIQIVARETTPAKEEKLGNTAHSLSEGAPVSGTRHLAHDVIHGGDGATTAPPTRRHNGVVTTHEIRDNAANENRENRDKPLRWKKSDDELRGITQETNRGISMKTQSSGVIKTSVSTSSSEDGDLENLEGPWATPQLARVVQELVVSRKFNMTTAQAKKRHHNITRLDGPQKDRTLIFDSSKLSKTKAAEKSEVVPQLGAARTKQERRASQTQEEALKGASKGVQVKKGTRRGSRNGDQVGQFSVLRKRKELINQEVSNSSQDVTADSPALDENLHTDSDVSVTQKEDQRVNTRHTTSKGYRSESKKTSGSRGKLLKSSSDSNKTEAVRVRGSNDNDKLLPSPKIERLCHSPQLHKGRSSSSLSKDPSPRHSPVRTRRHASPRSSPQSESPRTTSPKMGSKRSSPKTDGSPRSSPAARSPRLGSARIVKPVMSPSQRSPRVSPSPKQRHKRYSEKQKTRDKQRKSATNLKSDNDDQTVGTEDTSFESVPGDEVKIVVNGEAGEGASSTNLIEGPIHQSGVRADYRESKMDHLTVEGVKWPENGVKISDNTEVDQTQINEELGEQTEGKSETTNTEEIKPHKPLRRQPSDGRQRYDALLESKATHDQRQQRYVYIASKISGKLDSEIIQFFESQQQKPREIARNEKLIPELFRGNWKADVKKAAPSSEKNTSEEDGKISLEQEELPETKQNIKNSEVKASTSSLNIELVPGTQDDASTREMETAQRRIKKEEETRKSEIKVESDTDDNEYKDAREMCNEPDDGVIGDEEVFEEDQVDNENDDRATLSGRGGGGTSGRSVATGGGREEVITATIVPSRGHTSRQKKEGLKIDAEAACEKLTEGNLRSSPATDTNKRGEDRYVIAKYDTSQPVIRDAWRKTEDKKSVLSSINSLEYESRQGSRENIAHSSKEKRDEMIARFKQDDGMMIEKIRMLKGTGQEKQGDVTAKLDDQMKGKITACLMNPRGEPTPVGEITRDGETSETQREEKRTQTSIQKVSLVVTARKDETITDEKEIMEKKTKMESKEKTFVWVKEEEREKVKDKVCKGERVKLDQDKLESGGEKEEEGGTGVQDDPTDVSQAQTIKTVSVTDLDAPFPGDNKPGGITTSTKVISVKDDSEEEERQRKENLNKLYSVVKVSDKTILTKPNKESFTLHLTLVRGNAAVTRDQDNVVHDTHDSASYTETSFDNIEPTQSGDVTPVEAPPTMDEMLPVEICSSSEDVGGVEVVRGKRLVEGISISSSVEGLAAVLDLSDLASDIGTPHTLRKLSDSNIVDDDDDGMVEGQEVVTAEGSHDTPDEIERKTITRRLLTSHRRLTKTISEGNFMQEDSGPDSQEKLGKIPRPPSFKRSRTESEFCQAKLVAASTGVTRASTVSEIFARGVSGRIRMKSRSVENIRLSSLSCVEIPNPTDNPSLLKADSSACVETQNSMDPLTSPVSPSCRIVGVLKKKDSRENVLDLMTASMEEEKKARDEMAAKESQELKKIPVESSGTDKEITDLNSPTTSVTSLPQGSLGTTGVEATMVQYVSPLESCFKEIVTLSEPTKAKLSIVPSPTTETHIYENVPEVLFCRGSAATDIPAVCPVPSEEQTLTPAEIRKLVPKVIHIYENLQNAAAVPGGGVVAGIIPGKIWEAPKIEEEEPTRDTVPAMTFPDKETLQDVMDLSHSACLSASQPLLGTSSPKRSAYERASLRRKLQPESESRIEKQKSNYMRQKTVRVGILKKQKSDITGVRLQKLHYFDNELPGERRRSYSVSAGVPRKSPKSGRGDTEDDKDKASERQTTPKSVHPEAGAKVGVTEVERRYHGSISAGSSSSRSSAIDRILQSCAPCISSTTSSTLDLTARSPVHPSPDPDGDSSRRGHDPDDEVFCDKIPYRSRGGSSRRPRFRTKHPYKTSFSSSDVTFLRSYETQSLDEKQTVLASETTLESIKDLSDKSGETESESTVKTLDQEPEVQHVPLMNQSSSSLASIPVKDEPVAAVTSSDTTTYYTGDETTTNSEHETAENSYVSFERESLTPTSEKEGRPIDDTDFYSELLDTILSVVDAQDPSFSTDVDILTPDSQDKANVAAASQITASQITAENGPRENKAEIEELIPKESVEQVVETTEDQKSVSTTKDYGERPSGNSDSDSTASVDSELAEVRRRITERFPPVPRADPQASQESVLASPSAVCPMPNCAACRDHVSISQPLVFTFDAPVTTPPCCEPSRAASLPYVDQPREGAAHELFSRSTSLPHDPEVYHSTQVVCRTEHDDDEYWSAGEEAGRGTPQVAPSSILPQASSPQESSPQESSAQDSSPQESSPQEPSPQEPSPQESSPQESSAQDSSPQDSSPQDLSPEDQTSQDDPQTDSGVEGCRVGLKDGFDGRDVTSDQLRCRPQELCWVLCCHTTTSSPVAIASCLCLYLVMDLDNLQEYDVIRSFHIQDPSKPIPVVESDDKC
ncbi:LWamide neuropeptides-like 4 [Homarus americanus]|uniref:LWamide neuropeptides-like 4 n=1 Tax=Homarus americanus TaxID=6706 RepID=A0A8J5TH26_HOMAM|nr:LWamide neuropeptides-like 4 [Homarus americanus]